MKNLIGILLISTAVQSAFAAGNNYSEIERKEQQRLEQSRRDHAKRQQDSARANREYQERMSNFSKKNTSGSTSSKPGRMLDIKP